MSHWKQQPWHRYSSVPLKATTTTSLQSCATESNNHDIVTVLCHWMQQLRQQPIRKQQPPTTPLKTVRNSEPQLTTVARRQPLTPVRKQPPMTTARKWQPLKRVNNNNNNNKQTNKNNNNTHNNNNNNNKQKQKQNNNKNKQTSVTVSIWYSYTSTDNVRVKRLSVDYTHDTGEW